MSRVRIPLESLIPSPIWKAENGPGSTSSVDHDSSYVVLTDDQDVGCERWKRPSSILLIWRALWKCKRMPQSWIALWWSVLCLYGLLNMFGLTWRDHVLCALLWNLIGASKMCVAIVDWNYTEVLLASFWLFIWGQGTYSSGQKKVPVPFRYCERTTLINVGVS